MAYLFHKKLITSSTNTIIKDTAKYVSIIGVIQKARHSQNLVFLVSNITFFWLRPLSLRHYFVAFLSTSPPIFPEWPTFWIVPCFYHIIILFKQNCSFLEAHVDFRSKKIAPAKFFGYLPVNYQRWSSFYIHLKLDSLPVSFPKSCLEKPLCKGLVSGTCR